MTNKKNIHVVFFDTFNQAKTSKDKIKSSCSGCDQLNLVIHEEGNMDDPELFNIDKKIKVYAGEAWTTIHKKMRLEQGYYQEDDFIDFANNKS